MHEDKMKFIRGSFFGRVVYHITRHKYFGYKEEDLSYLLPSRYYDYYSHNLNGNFIGQRDEDLKEVQEIEKRYPALCNPILVDWDGLEDLENPNNWPFYQKVIFGFQISFNTFSVYVCSAIYAPAITEVGQYFGVSQYIATLPLTTFVIGYGIGPLLFSPMSENSRFGRNNIYITTMFIYTILQIPTALSPNISCLCILRFFGGLFASPFLATGGASIADVVSLPNIPIGIAFWGIATFLGPALGPVIGSVLSVKANWRWIFWYTLISCSFSLLLSIPFLPETHHKTILRRKAERLRIRSGNQNIRSGGELENIRRNYYQVAADILWRPFAIIFAEPILLVLNLYLLLVYSMMYLWFAAFPIVFIETYGFTLIEMGVCSTSFLIGVMIAAVSYIPFVYHKYSKHLGTDIIVEPETFLLGAIFGSIMLPIGAFIFAWTSSASIHWIFPLAGSAIFALGAYIIFQAFINYLSISFWGYLASVFAGNGLFKSAVASCSPLFGLPLFNHLSIPKFPVAWGATVIGLISLVTVLIPVWIYKQGYKVRTRSKYAGNALYDLYS